MKKIIGTFILVLAASVAAAAQTDCPADKVCISAEAARKAIAAMDRVEALEKEIAAKDQAVADLKALIEALKIELAKTTGEKTGAEQQVVRQQAIIDLLLKYARPKKIGLINLF